MPQRLTPEEREFILTRLRGAFEDSTAEVLIDVLDWLEDRRARSYIQKLEQALARLTEQQEKVEQAIGRLAEAQARTEERVGRLEERVGGVEERVGRLEEAIGRLAEAQART
ncbi:MAG: hypothetical protein D6723_00445, partial [Acidobacteria bacterium]